MKTRIKDYEVFLTGMKEFAKSKTVKKPKTEAQIIARERRREIRGEMRYARHEF
jgi:hypothetical protein